MATKETSEEVFKFPRGSVIWAQIRGYPNWPGIIEEAPNSECFCEDCEAGIKYHITFFGNPVTRAWVSQEHVIRYVRVEEFPKVKGKHKKLKQDLENSIRDANKALRLSYQVRNGREYKAEACSEILLQNAVMLTREKERFARFGFTKRYKTPPEVTIDSDELSDDEDATKRKENLNKSDMKDELKSTANGPNDRSKGKKRFSKERNGHKIAKTTNESCHDESKLVEVPASKGKSKAKGNKKRKMGNPVKQACEKIPSLVNEDYKAKRTVDSDEVQSRMKQDAMTSKKRGITCEGNAADKDKSEDVEIFHNAKRSKKHDSTSKESMNTSQVTKTQMVEKQMKTISSDKNYLISGSLADNNRQPVSSSLENGGKDKQIDSEDKVLCLSNDGFKGTPNGKSTAQASTRRKSKASSMPIKNNVLTIDDKDDEPSTLFNTNVPLHNSDGKSTPKVIPVIDIE